MFPYSESKKSGIRTKHYGNEFSNLSIFDHIWYMVFQIINRLTADIAIISAIKFKNKKTQKHFDYAVH